MNAIKQIFMGKNPRTSFMGIIAAVMILLMQGAALSGTPIPVIDETGAVKIDDEGQVVYQDPPPFNLDAVLLALGIFGVARVAGDSANAKG